MALDEQTMQMLQEEIAREEGDPAMEQELELDRQVGSANVAEGFDEQRRRSIAEDLLERIDADNDSRLEWLKRNQEYLKLAVQVTEQKSFPWPNASNVKYPLLTTAVMQFHSRCYKALLSGNQPVRARVIGSDKLGLKKERANRISQHMSYQLLEEMPNWEEHMDTLCMVVPICGNAYKKTYFDGNSSRSELVLPQDLIVNFYANSIEDTERKTHIMPLTLNQLVSNVRSGYYVNIDLENLVNPDPEAVEHEDALLEGQGLTKPDDDTDPAVPYTAYECCCWLDLDEDMYAEPYIVTILKETREVVRITPRFSAKDIELNERGEIVRIKPVELYTNYRFVPDPRSGVYGLGFGHILGPINEATNTLINQIIDSGTMNNMPSGWLARGARMQSGDISFKPGEWKVMNTMGDDLRKSVVPLPTKEPSAVLFNLLGLLIQAGNELAGATNMMKGESPGQNQPFSTTSAMLEQGMAVYSTIFKRMHRAFKRELTKLYRLNQLYLPPEVYFDIVDPATGETTNLTVERSDYVKDTTNVVPSSDPEQVTNFQKLADAELLFNLLQTGLINPQVAVKRILEARGIEGQVELLTLPPPQPNPEMVLKEKELAIKEKDIVGRHEIDQFKAQYQAARDQAASIAKMAEAQMANAQMQLDIQEARFNQMLEAAKLALEERKVETDKLKMEKEERDKKTIKASDLKKKSEKKE